MIVAYGIYYIVLPYLCSETIVGFHHLWGLLFHNETPVCLMFWLMWYSIQTYSVINLLRSSLTVFIKLLNVPVCWESLISRCDLNVSYWVQEYHYIILSVCLCVCHCVCVCVCVCVCLCLHACAHACVHAQVCVCVHTCSSILTCLICILFLHSNSASCSHHCCS